VAFQPGPDPHFPYLSEDDYYQFPPPNEWDGDIVAVGGNLSPGMLLSAYEQGVFPWYNPGDPVIWQSPDPRCVIFPENLHVSSSMRKIFNSGLFRITIDEDFSGVIKGCADIYRPGQGGTWISDDIIKAYTELHRLGWAHSAESWQDGELVGGCYGVIISDVFFGESMFSRKSNASKAAFLCIAEKMFEDGSPFIDCQIPTTHLMSMGGEIMPRQEFISLLKGIFHSRVRNS
jgi:leucyl/phenylalanyl-tRNA--protein transferase